MVRDSGGEGKPAVVLAHGLGFGQRSWDRVAPHLSAEGLRVVTYDQRGHGGSDASNDYSPPTFERDLAAVLETLELREPVLVGHSLGATIAIGYAAARGRTAGVVCVDGGLPVSLPGADWDTMEAEMCRPLVRVGVWAMKVARLGAKPGSRSPWPSSAHSARPGVCQDDPGPPPRGHRGASPHPRSPPWPPSRRRSSSRSRRSFRCRVRFPPDAENGRYCAVTGHVTPVQAPMRSRRSGPGIGGWATPRRVRSTSHFPKAPLAHLEEGSGPSKTSPTAIPQGTHSLEGKF